MKKYYKLLIFPAIIMIVAGIFSGFSEQSYSQIAESLLEERTKVLQNAYYGKIEMDKAETYLSRIETYPLLSEDIGNLRQADPAQLDTVKTMEFIDITKEYRMFEYVCFHMKIRWYMSGLSADYISDNEYSVVLKSTKSGYKLAEFNPK